MIVDHTLARLASLPGTAPTLALHVYLPLVVEFLVKGVTVPVRGLEGRLTGLASCTLASWTVHNLVDEGALAVTCHAPLLPVCGLADPGRGLLTATGTDECARILGVTVCSLDDCACVRMAIARPGVSHYWSCDRSPLSSDLWQSRKRSWRPGRSRRDHEEAVVASRDCSNSGSTVEPAPAVAGSSIPLPTSSLQDLVRLFLSLSGPVDQQDAAVGSLLTAAGVTGAGVLPGPAAPVTSAAPVAGSSASVTAPVVVIFIGAASATTSPSRHERAWESSRPECRRRRLSGRERSHSCGKRGRGRPPSPARSARSASVSASSSSGSLEPEERASAMPPPPSGRPGVGGGRSKGDCSPQPGPLGLGSGEQSAPGADRSRFEYRCRSSPTPSGVAEDNHDSSSGSVDLDRDDSFRAVFRLIQEFHSMEEPASVAPNRCKTSLAPIYGLQSQPSPALHLLLSPLLRSLLDDTNLALAKFVEDQTVHGSLPVPGRRHRRSYRTSSSSFPGPYTVPPGLASITLDQVSALRKRSISLSHSQVSSLETMLSGVCEVTSWLDWWLSTCGGFREHLTDEARGNFERLMLSGSRALEFLGHQGVTALGSLMLSRRDSLLLDARSTVPAEEVTRLHYADLPTSSGIFPSALFNSALTKMRAALNDALVQRMLHPPKIPRKSSSGPSKAGSSSASSADCGGVSPMVPRSQQQASTTPSSSSSQQGRKNSGHKGKAPFSGGSGCSGGKRKGAGKKSS